MAFLICRVRDGVGAMVKRVIPPTPRGRGASNKYPTGDYSTVTDLAKFLGWSTSVPLYTAT